MDTPCPPLSLRARLAGGPLPTADAIRVAIGLCDLLAGGRDATRDVRPETLSPGYEGRVDWVTAAAAETREPYLAPECQRGWSTGDGRSDVFVVGTILYEMLVGRTPTGRFPWPGQVDPAHRWIDPVVLRCLADDPAQRYASVAELRAEVVARPIHTAVPLLVDSGTKWGTPSAAVACGTLLVGLRIAYVVVKVWFVTNRQFHPAAATPPARPAVVAVQSTPWTAPPQVSYPQVAVTPLPNAADVDAEDERIARESAALARAHHPPAKPRVVQLTDAPTASTTIANTPMVGGNGGGPFRKVGDGRRPMLGVTFQLGSWGGRPCLRSVEPLYGAGDDVYVIGRNGGTVLAKPGYAVAGLLVQADETNSVAFAILFMAWHNGHLVPTDQYTSPWYGAPVGDSPSLRLAGDGRTVVGVCGRQGMNLDALGLVVAAR